jgi:hypothetical protein
MLSEKIKIDVAVQPQSKSSDGTTGQYFGLAEFNTAVFHVSAGSAGLTTTLTALVYQATNANGGSAAAITTTSTVVYATSNMTLATITPTTSAGDTNATVTINGVQFTGVSGTSTTALASARSFVGNTADVSTTITNLAARVNDTDYGVPGVYASASSTTCTIRIKDGGDAYSLATSYNGIVMTSSNTQTMTLANLQMDGIVAIASRALSLSSDMTHVALNVVATSAVQMAATVIRDGSRVGVKQLQPVTQVG